jgi:hypothetical protein
MKTGAFNKGAQGTFPFTDREFISNDRSFESRFLLLSVCGDGLRKFLLHEATHLEFDGPFGRDLNSFESFRILGYPCGSRSCFKNTEVTKFKAIALGQLVDNFIEKRLNNPLYDDSFSLSFLCYSVN